MMSRETRKAWISRFAPRVAGLPVAFRMPVPSSSAEFTVPSSVAAAVSMAACSRSDDSRTAGQKVDDTIAKVEQKTEEIKAEVREAARDAKQAGADAAQGASNKVSEAKQATVNVAEAAADKVKDAVQKD